MKKVIQTSNAPAAIGPYSQGIISGDFLFISGQLPIDPQHGKLIDGSIASQTDRILKNITVICQEAETDITNIVKTTIFLADLQDFAEVNEAYGSYFKNSPPARSTIQVAALPLDAKIEIDAIVALA